MTIAFEAATYPSGRWHGRRVYNRATGAYMGRAVGEPSAPDGVEGIVELRQDDGSEGEWGYAVCAYVVLDEPVGPPPRSE